MRRLAIIVAAIAVATGCEPATDDDAGDDVSLVEQALNVLKTGSLIRKQGQIAGVRDEGSRRADTQAYYDLVRTGSNGSSGGSISSSLPTLQTFINTYGFAGAEVVANYYNRGDLGIGREMHCVDRLTSTGEIACYVRNFAAGDDNSEFTFGMSNSVAFNNMDKNHPFATVAMVYRDSAPPANKVFFAVYGATGSLQTFAALDRTGILSASGKDTTSVPGVNFNNHIPSNCVACHGGSPYNATNHSQTGSLFLPFDLDQFEYQSAANRSRSGQLAAFKRLNEMVWKIAVRSGSNTNNAVMEQLDGWYANQSRHQADNRFEVFEGDFNSNYLPPGWTSSQTFYFNVMRPICRGCHMTNSLPFKTEAEFAPFAGSAVEDLCNFSMPHALQTVRDFWQSGKPRDMETWLRGVGKSAEANRLHGCGPADVATLDPQHIMNVLTMMP